jgi:hypothetical protein
LLEFLFEALWKMRQGTRLQYDAYHRLRRVGGAIAHRADEVFERELRFFISSAKGREANAQEKRSGKRGWRHCNRVTILLIRRRSKPCDIGRAGTTRWKSPRVPAHTAASQLFPEGRSAQYEAHAASGRGKPLPAWLLEDWPDSEMKARIERLRQSKESSPA